jgi:hypothetical protein
MAVRITAGRQDHRSVAVIRGPHAKGWSCDGPVDWDIDGQPRSG